MAVNRGPSTVTVTVTGIQRATGAEKPDSLILYHTPCAPIATD